MKAEFALLTVATVTRVIARYETLCRGVARNFYILRQEIGLEFVTTQSGACPPGNFCILDLFDSIWWHFRLSNRHPHALC